MVLKVIEQHLDLLVRSEPVRNTAERRIVAGGRPPVEDRNLGGNGCSEIGTPPGLPVPLFLSGPTRKNLVGGGFGDGPKPEGSDRWQHVSENFLP